MGAITAVSRVIGFVRVIVIAAVLGTTYLGNAFQSANSLSNVLFELLAAGALSAVLVPIFVELLDRGDQHEAEEVAGAVLGAALIVLGAVSVLGIIGAPLLARVLSAGVPASVVDAQRALTAHLLRFFVPQVLLYAFGAVAIAALHAKRRFAVTAAAPIGNTVVMVAALAALRVLTGPKPGFDLTTVERAMLVVAGTGGVVAFVAILLVACERSGFRLRPRMPRREGRVFEALRHSGWGVILHTGSGLLLGGAVIAGAAVQGGVVAYQVAWVFFLAPYAVLAQPIHTAILPELVGEANEPAVFAASIRWSLERMALLVLPVAAGLMALSGPAMRVVSFGETGPEGASLIAAALASLAVGLFPYGAFLLLARGYYARGDSRTPGIVSVACACIGLLVMVLGAVTTDGSARIAMLGLGHTTAYVVGTVVLGIGLTRRVGESLLPGAIVKVLAVVACSGGATWFMARVIAGSHATRIEAIVACVAGAAVGGVLVVGGYRVLGIQALLTRRGPVEVTG